MFYCDPHLIQRAADEMSGKSVCLPFFQKGVIEDDDLASEIHSFHIALSNESMGKLEMESRFLHMLIRFVGRHADMSYPLMKAGQEHPAVLIAKRMMEDLYFENISLSRTFG